MIGDHQQLPPFNADRLQRLLASPTRIADALELGGSLVGRPFREADMDDVIDEPSADLTEVCGEAAGALMMFETLVEGELARAAKDPSPSSLTIAQRLKYQHRMHPAIARLVSASFYSNDLETDEAAAGRFASSRGPVASIDPRRLPSSPIVVVDMPFVQNEMNARRYEMPPRFHNPTEVHAIIEVLSLLRPASREGSAPSLAVLAPYREQVKRLRHRIAEQRQKKLQHLSGFTFEGEADSPTGTVDSFQGSEADVVVLSLVRNNHHAGLRGLGFLADARRMNVLLSRARWKLVLVVSLDFLKSRTAAPLQSGQSLDFLKRMLRTLATLQIERGADGVPLASVLKFRDLMGRS
jgi:superfamily I DNA and/or RNA helicase